MPVAPVLKSSAFSVKNSESEDKPNEDCFIADDNRGIYIVADGITSTPSKGENYPSPSGGELSARILCETVYQCLLSQPNVGIEDAYEALRTANQEIHILNHRYERYSAANFVDVDYFATVGTLAIVIEDKVYILHVGDTMVLLQRQDSLELLTDIQTRNVIDYRNRIKQSGIIPARDLTVAIRRDFRNNINAKGILGEQVGYGAFTGVACYQTCDQVK